MLTHLTLPNTVFIGLALLSAAVGYYFIERVRHELRVRKIGGVRAPQLGRDPFSATLRFIKVARAHRENRLLEVFDGYFENATPECPDCVEIQIKPRQRYLMTRNPEHVKTVLTTKFAEFGKGEFFHDLWQPFLGDSIFTTDGQLWHDSRNIIRPMFIKERVSDLATFERWSGALMTKLPHSGETVDIMDLFYRMTLDVTTDFLLGASVDSLNNPQNEFATAFNEVQNIQMVLTMIGPFAALMPRGRYKRGIKSIDKFVMPYIEQALRLPDVELEKLSNSDKGFTFLHSVARHTRSPKVLRDQIVAVLLAGRDTTAATLSWAIYELSHYPEKYDKLRKEVIDTVGREHPPTYEDIKNMKYLRHTLNETLRLYPAIPFNLRAALEDTTLPGMPGQPPISVVEGDIVLYSTLSMQRRKDLCPPTSDAFANPALFSPERWDHWTPKHWQYIPFNGGPRICIGQNFAMTEMAYCLIRILQKYERLEYRGDWYAQRLQTEVVGKPSQGVKVALYEDALEVDRGAFLSMN